MIMEDSENHEYSNNENTPNKDLLNSKNTNIVQQKSEKEPNAFNETLLASLPHPAMYVRNSDRVIIAANTIAENFGAKIGGHCWREFGKCDYISEADFNIAINHPELLPENTKIKCSFCKADECIEDSPYQNNSEVKAFGKIWDTYWIKVSADVFLHYMVDITAQKQLGESLRKSELFLKQTQQISMLGTYSLDISTGIWECSKVMENIFGIDANYEKTIQSWRDILHPDWKEIMSNYFNNEVLEKKLKFDKEYKIIRNNDKTVRWVHGLGDLKFDEFNNPIKMIGTIRDITDRKIEQTEIIRNLKFTEVLLKSIPTPVFFKDINGLYTGCNKAFTDLIGISNEEINGKSVMDLWPGKLANIYHQKDLELLSTQEFQTYESKITDKNNQTRNVIFAKNVFFDEEGKPAGIVGTFVDITEQKQIENELRKSEQKYKLIAKNATDGIFTCKDGLIEYVNHSMCRIFNYEAHELEGMKLSELIIAERREEFETHVTFDSTSNHVNNIEIECQTKDNSIKDIEIYMNYVANDKLIYGVLQDITERKHTQEKKIIKAIIQTEEKERSNFSKELHDGLGPLLSTIKLYLQSSLRPKTNKSRKEIISKAEEIVEEALIAVKEISNRLSPHLLTNYGLTSAIQNFLNKVVQTNALKVDFQSNLSRRIEIEVEVALYRVIIECVNNTVKYARAKHIYIKLNDTGNRIDIQYRDDGRGFDIVQVLSEKKGLGLFNLQNRIKTIGGEIKMFSNRNNGVNYQIFIPIKQIK